ncbi:MAG: DUF503 domain-containing protein [Chloroflexi bacterium]|nr:DUF503 domain-containing protein [Chloroflexota bacterium]
MVIGVCSLQLYLPAAHSLKDKRRVIRSLTARLRQRFNVSVSESGDQNLWQSAQLAVVCVSTDQQYAHGLLTKAVGFVESSRLDLQVVDYQLEFY